MRHFIPLLCFLAASACAPVTKRNITKALRNSEEEMKYHTGFVLYDPVKKKTLYDYNGSSYFTPASNTKILTLYASLLLLGDSIPALKYFETPDSLIVWGTGDPSFLYSNVYNNNRVFNFLARSNKPIYFSNSNFHTAHFGAGWSWDDYNSHYSVERSPFPIYGNCFFVYPFEKDVYVWPSYFRDKFTTGRLAQNPNVIRDAFSNNVVYHPGETQKNKEWIIPFRIDQDLISVLLWDTLKQNVKSINKPMPLQAKTLYSIPSDSLYKEMMQISDNLIAEQLLMMCAHVLSDSLQPEIAIRWMQQNQFNTFADKPIWVDGSGLSRYNLFTPRSIVEIWERIYHVVPRERLFPLLATGGKRGTLKNWYKADKPYVFGKTGTISNNHTLSGFLVTKSGKTLIFSFMNANFTVPTNDIRRNMQSILNSIYEKY